MTDQVYYFRDVDTGEPVDLNLNFQYIMLFQKNGLMEWGGRLLRRDVGRELAEKPLRAGPDAPIHRTGQVKHKSENALSVHPDQVSAYREFARDVHPGVSFTNDGTVHFSSRGARKAYLKARGMRDRDGGYGD